MSGLLNRAASDAALSAEAQMLFAKAEQAGAALACLYSSSEEFDAALIAQRRDEGVYGPKRQRRNLLISAAGVVAGLAVIVAVIQLL